MSTPTNPGDAWKVYWKIFRWFVTVITIMAVIMLLGLLLAIGWELLSRTLPDHISL